MPPLEYDGYINTMEPDDTNQIILDYFWYHDTQS